MSQYSFRRNYAKKFSIKVSNTCSKSFIEVEGFSSEQDSALWLWIRNGYTDIYIKYTNYADGYRFLPRKEFEAWKWHHDKFCFKDRKTDAHIIKSISALKTASSTLYD